MVLAVSIIAKMFKRTPVMLESRKTKCLMAAAVRRMEVPCNSRPKKHIEFRLKLVSNVTVAACT